MALVSVKSVEKLLLLNNSIVSLKDTCHGGSRTRHWNTVEMDCLRRVLWSQVRI
jgi:hypothetical protein